MCKFDTQEACKIASVPFIGSVTKKHLNKEGTVQFEELALAFALKHLDLLLYITYVLASGLITFALPLQFHGAVKYNGAHIAARFAVLQLEGLGLILVRNKIKNRAGVGGISGATLVMLAMEYFFSPAMELLYGSYDIVTIWAVVPLLLTLDILHSVYVTHRDTYDAELDVLKTHYIVPGMVVLALLLHAPYGTVSESVGMAFVRYINAFGLMPQVVMMAKSGGNVQTPIANFVAVTAISRCSDIFDTLFIAPIFEGVSNWDALWYWVTGNCTEESSAIAFGYVIIIATEILQIVLLVDFLYYFFKARAHANPSRDEISLFDLATSV